MHTSLWREQQQQKRTYILFEGVLWDFKNVTFYSEQGNCFEQEVIFMKGYNTASGYMGLVDGAYILFATESDYLEYMEEC